jgi:tellurite resistance protein TehA-like permease
MAMNGHHQHHRIGLSWFAVVLLGALAPLAWSEGLAMMSVGSALLASMTYSIFSQRRMREILPGRAHHVLTGLLILATGCALLGTFAATNAVIADDQGNDRSLSYGMVCAIALIFGYRALIKRTPRSVAVLATFAHVVGLIVVIYNFIGHDNAEEWGSEMVVRTTPAALALYGLLATTATACGVALLYFVPAREDDELAAVPAAHLIDA